MAATIPNMLFRLPIATLNTILVEPSLLTRLSTAKHDPTNTDLAHFLSLACSCYSEFCIVYDSSLPILYHCHDPLPQLSLPEGNGFC